MSPDCQHQLWLHATVAGMAGGREDDRMESTAAAAGENSEESNCLNGEAEAGGGDGR